jgi:YgiT-type zinc finger domain-containing protein
MDQHGSPQESTARTISFLGREEGDTDMGCHTPGCTGEHESGTIRHTVLYRKRSIVLHGVPASLCPECGDVVLTEETTLAIEYLLKRKARSKKPAFVYEP